MAAIKQIFMNLKVPYRSVFITTGPTEVEKSKGQSLISFTITCNSNFDGKITAF